MNERLQHAEYFSEINQKNVLSYSKKGEQILNMYRSMVDADVNMTDQELLQDLFTDIFHRYGSTLELPTMFGYSKSVYHDELKLAEGGTD